MQKEIIVYLDNIRSVYNVGSIFRTAEAMGVTKIILGGVSGVERFGEVVKLNPKVAKTALEGINAAWEHTDNFKEMLTKLKENGFQIVSLELTPQSLDYRSAQYSDKVCLIVGHERDGVNPELVELADFAIEIPMHGQGKSLNVAVAAGIALFNLQN